MTKFLMVAVVFCLVAFGASKAQAQDLDMTVQLLGGAWVDDEMLHELIADGAQDLLGYEAIVRTRITRTHRLTTVVVHIESPTLGTDNMYALRVMVDRTTHRADITLPTVNGRVWRRGDRIAAL